MIDETELNIKIENLFPSSTKPGVFYVDQLATGSNDEGEVKSPEYWNKLTGIDYNTTNRFRYAIGTWTEVTRQNRTIKIYPNDMMDFIRLGADAEPGESKPSYLPDGILENTEENAEALEPKPPDDSRKMWSCYRIYERADFDFNDSDSNTMYDYGYDPMFRPDVEHNIVKKLAEDNVPGYQHILGNEEREEWLEGDFEYAKYEVSMPGAYIAESENVNLAQDTRPGTRWSGYATITDGVKSTDRIDYFDVGIKVTYDDVGIKQRHGGYVKAGGNWKIGTVDSSGGSYHAQGLGTWHHKKLTIDMLPFHNNEILDSSNPEFKLHDVRRGTNAKATAEWKEPYTDEDLQKMGQGYWRVKPDSIELVNPYLNKKGKRPWYKRLKNAVGNLVRSGGTFNYNAVYFKYEWEPNLDNDPYFNRAGAYSDEYEWKWNGREWTPAETLLESPQIRKPKNKFIGVAISSKNEPDMLNAVSNIRVNNLPIYHEVNTEDYLNNSAPLSIWFGVDFYQQDLESTFAANRYKYHVIQWGDEDELLSDEEIMESEFFSIYDVEEGDFDRTQAKKLTQIVKSCNYIKKYGTTQFDVNAKLQFTQHNYLTGGVKSIKTVVFRLNAEETSLYETTLITTNINVADVNESLEDFNIYGASEFNVLPINLNKNELIIGGIDKNSDYVNSIKQIDKDDSYGSKDYLEKQHINKFLPKVNNSEYGDHPGKLDLATTRVFTKPYDISYFTDRIPTTKRRSRATDILIDNKDCIVELNPQKQIGIAVENTGQSNARGVMVGEYTLKKENKDLELKKDGIMKVSKIDKKNKEQAI